MEPIKTIEKSIDKYEDKLGDYLVQLAQHNMSNDDSAQVNKILHVISDFERISDYSVNLALTAREMVEKQVHFSDDAMKEISILENATHKLLDITATAFIENNLNKAYEVEPLQHVIKEMIGEIKNNHIERLRNKECTIELGFVLSDLLNAYERASAHCANIAIAVVEAEHKEFTPHESARKYRKDANSTYQSIYQENKSRYSLA